MFDREKADIIKLTRMGLHPNTILRGNKREDVFREIMQMISQKLVRILRFVGCCTGVLTVAVAVGALLFSAGITDARAEDSDKMVVLSVTTQTDGVLQVPSASKVQFSVQVDGKTYPIFTDRDTVSEALKENGFAMDALDHLSGANADDTPVDGMNVTLVRVSKKVITESETLWAQTKYVLDKSLMAGEYVTRTPAKNGSIVRTYEIVYENGVAVSKTLIGTTRTEPVHQLIAYNEKYSFSNSRGQQVTYSSAINGVATAYIPDGKWGYTTYTGNRARPGVIAVDPKVIPLGTKVYVKTNKPGFGDYGFAIAWDIGGAIKGNKIDLFMESYDLSIQWGLRDVTIYILDDQSVDIFSLRQGNEVFIR